MAQTDAAFKIETIYDPDGNPVKVTRLNAHDLTRMGYSWTKNPKIEADPEAVAEPDTGNPSEGTSSEQNNAVIVTDEAAKQPDADLEREAKDVGDYDSLADYLDTFDAAALRVILEEKFGEKAHARTGKDKLVEKIVAYYDEAAIAKNQGNTDDE